MNLYVITEPKLSIRPVACCHGMDYCYCHYNSLITLSFIPESIIIKSSGHASLLRLGKWEHIWSVHKGHMIWDKCKQYVWSFAEISLTFLRDKSHDLLRDKQIDPLKEQLDHFAGQTT